MQNVFHSRLVGRIWIDYNYHATNSYVMTIAPLQYFGHGDIHFCQQLANIWIAEGHSVVWGTLPEWVDGFNRAFPKVKFVDYRNLPIDYNRKDEHDANGYRVIPLRWSDSLMDVHYNDCMKSKYSLFGIDFNEWRKGGMWRRDLFMENVVLEMTGASSQRPYNLINMRYQSDEKGVLAINPRNGKDNIVMQSLTGFSLFDWTMVLLHAKEIHVVSSSIIYLLEMLPLSCPIHLYPRPTDPKFKQVEYLLTKPYILH